MRERAVEGVVAIARSFGLNVTEPVILRDRSNFLIHLKPYPIVARVPNKTSSVRNEGGRGGLEREAKVVTHLSGTTAPTVRVSPLMPPGPFDYEDLSLTFLEWLDPAPALPSDPTSLGRSLRQLHEGLQGYRGELPWLGPVAEIRACLDLIRAMGSLAQADLDVIEKAYRRVEENLLPTTRPGQALHGDAHAGNVLTNAERGLVWIDFEDCCSGPVQWDLACLIAGAYIERPDAEFVRLALAGYGFEGAEADLIAFVEGRVVQSCVWLPLLTEDYELRQARLAPYLTWLRSQN